MAFFVFVKGRLSSHIEKFFCGSLFLYYMKQIDSMLPCVCSVIDHRRRQNVVRTSLTHSAIASCATFLFLPHFDVICGLLLNRRTTTLNLCVKYEYFYKLGELKEFLKPPYLQLTNDPNYSVCLSRTLLNFTNLLIKFNIT